MEEYETEEIRRDVAMMARLQEQRRAYFEEGIIPEDSLGRAYVLDYYDASTSADLVETESELSCEEESRGSKRKADEDEEDEDEEQGKRLSYSVKWSMITTNNYFQKCALLSVFTCRMIAIRRGWVGGACQTDDLASIVGLWFSVSSCLLLLLFL